MNPREILNLIPDIIAQRETSPTDKWVLMIVKNEIVCIASENVGSEGFPLTTITMKHVDQGFVGREWDKVANRIKAYRVDHPDFYPTEPTLRAMKCMNCNRLEDLKAKGLDTEGWYCEWVDGNKCINCYHKNGNLRKTATKRTALVKTEEPENVTNPDTPDN